MGQAKNRGSFEVRAAQAVQRQQAEEKKRAEAAALAKVERQHQAALHAAEQERLREERLAKEADMTPEERAASRLAARTARRPRPHLNMGLMLAVAAGLSLSMAPRHGNHR